jgi:DNA-binding MarR family transcriptional regulator
MCFLSSLDDLADLFRSLEVDRQANQKLLRLNAEWAAHLEEFVVLYRLGLAERTGMSIQDLAAALDVSSATLLRRFVALERRGLVQRVARSLASGGCNAHVSTKGEKVLESFRQLLWNFSGHAPSVLGTRVKGHSTAANHE